MTANNVDLEEASFVTEATPLSPSATSTSSAMCQSTSTSDPSPSHQLIHQRRSWLLVLSIGFVSIISTVLLSSLASHSHSRSDPIIHINDVSEAMNDVPLGRRDGIENPSPERLSIHFSSPPMLGATSNIIHKSSYPLRWGILGPGRIANDFTSTLLTSGCTVSAVASSSLSRAQSFAQHFGIPSHYGSYEELASDPNVDIVYVATTNQNHLQPTLLMLRHGKNVLVEKPTTITYEDTKLMYAEAEKRGLFLMTNHWTRFFPLIKYLRRNFLTTDGIDDLNHSLRSHLEPSMKQRVIHHSYDNSNKVPRNYQLGKVVAMHGDFGFPTPLSPSDRFLNRTLGGGVTLDVGCYLVELALLAAHDHRNSQFSTTRALKKSDMKSRGGLEMDLKPDGVIATGHGLYNGLTFPVDVESSFSLRWGGGSYGIWNGECSGSAAEDDTTIDSKVNDNSLCDTISIGGKKTNTPHITKETNSLDRFTMLATFQASFRRPSTFEVEYVFEHGRILIRGPGNCPSEMTIYEHEPFGPLVRETAVSFQLPAVETAVRKYGRSNYPRAEGFVYVIEAIERCMAVRGVPGRDGIGEGDGVDGNVGCLELEENTIEEQLVTVEVTEEVLKKMGYLNFG